MIESLLKEAGEPTNTEDDCDEVNPIVDSLFSANTDLAKQTSQALSFADRFGCRNEKINKRLINLIKYFLISFLVFGFFFWFKLSSLKIIQILLELVALSSFLFGIFLFFG